MRHRVAQTAALVCVLVSSATCHAQNNDAGAMRGARVETTAGPVIGSVNSTTIAYLGIRFARPPSGELRWRPPVPAHPWSEPFDAREYGKRCFQSPIPGEKGDPSKRQINASEDCLFLNVFVPKSRKSGVARKRLKPVMVLIHGGANMVGASEINDPTPLVETGDVVAVSFNYRLGPFGFLAHPQLDSEGHAAANYGIMDQQLALKWVRDNIERFGGDSRNVTIFGNSAGGLNVTTHLVSPLSKGLFHKAIIQSGAYQLDTPSLAESEALGIAFAERVGCKDQTAACLRAVSALEIVAQTGDFTAASASANQSTVDGIVLPDTQRTALEAGNFHRVPVLLGSTSEEPAGFGCGALASMQSLSKWVPTYAYELSDPGASTRGAGHGTDQRYFLIMNQKELDVPAEDDGGPDNLPPASRELARAMRLSWAAFAATGNPRTTLIPRWPLATAGVMRLQPVLPIVAIPQADMRTRLKCASQRHRSHRPGQQ